MDSNTIDREERLEIWLDFLRAHSRITATLERELLEAEELSMSWFDVLEQLRQSPRRCLRMQDLGALLAMSASGLSRRVSRMEQAGLVARCPVPEDGRGVLVMLTDQGLSKYRRALPVHLRGVERHFLNHIDARDAGPLRDFFSRLQAAGSKDADIDVRR